MGVDDGAVGAEVAVVADGDQAVVLDHQVEVAEEALADLGVDAVVKLDRPLDEAALPPGAHDLADDAIPGLGLVFVQAVIVLAQVVAAQLDGAELRVAGAVDHAGENFFFLWYGHENSSFLGFCPYDSTK